MPLVVAIDVGTSSARALLYSGASARPLRHVRAGYGGAATGGSAGHASDVDAYLAAVRVVLDGIERHLEVTGRRADAAALSVFWHSAYLSSPEGPASPLCLWNAADRRFAVSAAQLRSRVHADSVRLAVGAPIHPSFPSGKAMALLGGVPDPARVGLQGLETALAQEFFGTREIHLSMASATGLYDQVGHRWHPEILGALGLRAAQLPEVVNGPDDVRALSVSARARWPRLAGAQWHLPRGDGALSHLGLGATGPRHWALTVGTSTALRTMTAWPDTSFGPAASATILPPGFPRALFRYRLDDRTAITGGALSAGGNLLAWVREHWTIRTARGGTRADSNAPALPDPGDPLVIPHLWGERSPDWPDRAWGGVLGLQDGTSPGDVERAAMQAIAATLGTVAEALGGCRDLGLAARPMSIRAGGRAVTASMGLRQMIADATGLPVECPEGADEASARGAMALALGGLGVSLPAPRIVTRRDPDPAARPAYQELWERIRTQTQGKGPG